MMLKSFWTSHLQMMNRLEPLFENWTGRSKRIPKDVDETNLRDNNKSIIIKNDINLYPFLCNISDWISSKEIKNKRLQLHKLINNKQHLGEISSLRAMVRIIAWWVFAFAKELSAGLAENMGTIGITKPIRYFWTNLDENPK